MKIETVGDLVTFLSAIDPKTKVRRVYDGMVETVRPTISGLAVDDEGEFFDPQGEPVIQI